MRSISTLAPPKPILTCPPETGPDPALGSWTKGRGRIPTKRYSTEQIVSKLRQAEEELSRGLRTPAMCKKRGISEQTYYRWRTKRSTIRFSKRWPRETSEPAETPAGGGLGPPPALGVSERRVCRECWARRGRSTGIGRGGRMMSHGWWSGSSRWRRSMGGRAIGGLRGCCVGRAGR